MTQRKRRFLSLCPLIIAGISGPLFLRVPPAAAQGNFGGQIGLRMNEVQKSNFCEPTQRLQVTVINENKTHLDRQAIVKIHDKKLDITSWDTTSNEAEVTFCNIAFGDYEIDAAAVGYLAEHRELHLTGLIQERDFKLVMHKDPMAVDLNAPDRAMPANARRETKLAVNALRSSNFKEARKQLERAYKLAPANAQVNFLLGYLSMQNKEMDKAENYLSRSATLDPHNVQSLTLLGRVQLERKENDPAAKTLEQAVAIDSTYWMAHYLLGDVYLGQKEQEKARDQAQLAIDYGKGAGNIANLVLGQALANLGKNQEAIQVLRAFVETNPGNTAIPQVKELIGRLEDLVAGRTPPPTQSKIDLALVASAPSLPPSAWGPPGVDELKPPVAQGVACPFSQVVEGSGERVKELVDNITKFAAIEAMSHEQLDKTGSPITKETRRFTYVASITEDIPGYLQTDEYRNLRYGVTDLPDNIVTSGSMTLALIFHPDMRDNFEMSCEGLGDWKGQSSWLVHFRQRDDKPNRFAEYNIGSQHYPMNLKGRAWVTADTLQIVHIDAELMKPLPQLSVQHQIADYGPIHFQQKNMDLWLPQNVDIFMELNRHYYHRRHSYDHFQLFAVDSIEKSGLFKTDDKTPVIKNALPAAPIKP
ncbi:MAG: tetratricopeptide repeat protein [Candidatus Sulfotelmatobacter sp.]|jgi:tetratricopeptide (TPR) repeat protein